MNHRILLKQNSLPPAIRLPSLALAMGMGWLAGTLSAEPAAGHPNLIVIMADDHAAAAMSCYNPRSMVPTPGIDRLAREGMRFTSCFGVDSLCAPSRAAMITGRYPSLNGFKRNGDRFNPSQPTFPALLQAAGYETALFGKWHLGSKPTGFDHWEILPGQGRYRNPAMLTADGKREFPGHFTRIVTDHAIDWLENRSSDKPFCLLLHHKAPHTPHHAEEPFAAQFRNRKLPEPPTFNDDFAGRTALARSRGRFSKLSDILPDHFNRKVPKGLDDAALKSWSYQTFFRGYLALVAQLDHEVARFLDYLDKSGLSGNTVVIYTSDNGFFLGEHGMFNKMWMYEPSLQLPLLVRWPGTVKPGTVNDSNLVSILDLAPTFLDLAGADRHPGFQGRSLRPLLRGQHPKDWRKTHYYRYYGQYDVPSHDGLRTARYKLIRFQEAGRKPEWELYDLQTDPDELHNIIGTDNKNEPRLRRILLEKARNP